jgi:hypothetical protein
LRQMYSSLSHGCDPNLGSDLMNQRRRDQEGMRSLYDWFHRFYGLVESNVGPSLARALDNIDPQGNRFAEDSVLEWACG